MEKMSGAGKRFENGFLAADAAHKAASLEKSELAPMILDLFKGAESVLEAGCGDGRWNVFLSSHGISNTGIDWSEKLCALGKKKSPASKFVSGDMNQMPFEDGEFDGLISLGAIEHVSIGPEKALCEFHRVLRSGSKALITVPNGCLLRKCRRIIPRIISRRQRNAWNTNVSKFSAVESYWPRFDIDQEGNIYFYEYEFSRDQIISMMKKCGFAIDEVFIYDHASGIYNSLWPLCGKDYSVRLNLLGRILQKLIPCSVSGQMIGCVVHK
jgi:ubiquinone/menaquinone biosynthesis C-methylase UbiE